MCPHKQPLPEGDHADVHTCATCFNKVFDTWADEYEGQCLIVPDDCPGWDARSGCALDCGGCRKEKDDLRKAHPRYAIQLAAAGSLMSSILRSVKAKQETPENVEDLGAHREQQSVISDMVASSNPWPGLRALAEDPETAPDVQWAGQAVDLLMAEAMRLPAVQEEWTRATNSSGWSEIRTISYMLDLVEAMYFAVTRHREDVDAQVHEWMLTYTDKPPVRRAWTRLSIPQRKLLLRVWRKQLTDREVG
ncbi:hypothetical protein N9917_00510 [Deltaproteobacteria bacterium]|nr:hypothetical protein [Deltaproteobacteria bacterium]